jgi:hypothetical protein
MKELALFGDSYAESCDKYANVNTVTNRGWAKQLMVMYGDAMDNFAQGGASLEFSVQNFLENHEKYKRIVFITTWINRLHIPITCKTPNSNKPAWTVDHWPGYIQCEYIENNFIIESSEEQQKLKAIKDYFIHITTGVYEEKYGLLRHRALIELVKKTRPDAIIIPARNYGLVDEYKWGLQSISTHEHILFSKFLSVKDIRHNHMTPASNKWVLEHVLHRLDGYFIELDLTRIPQFKNYDDLASSL